MTPPNVMWTKLPLVLLLLAFLHGTTKVQSQFASKIGSRVGGSTTVESTDGTTHSSPKQSSMVLPAVVQVLQEISEQIMDARGHNKKELRKGGMSGHKMPPHLLELVMLRNSLITAAKKRKMSEYNGYSDEVMPLLVKSSEGTAGEQLKMLLSAMLERKELKSEGDESTVRELARKVIKELEDEKSDLNAVIGHMEPVKYT